MGVRKIILCSVACALLLVGGFGAGWWFQGRRQGTVTVSWSGHTSHVVAGPGWTVGSVLAVAGAQPRSGRLMSVISHRVIDPHFASAELTVSGRPATLRTKVAGGDVVRMTDGVDAVEGVNTASIPTGPQETVSVLRYVDQPGRPGLLAGARGARSGEAFGQLSLEAPVAPTRRADKVVALTFDDGPSPYTARILDILKIKDVKATFCIIGIQAHKFPQLVRRIAAEGHATCDHTQNHDEHLDKKPQPVLDAEMDGALKAIADAGAPRPVFYRPPGGTLSPAIIATANAKGMQELHWSIDTEDWKRPGADKITARAEAVSPGAIVLMHDGGGDRNQTIEALPTVIDRIRELGYTFVLPESTLPGAPPPVPAGPLPAPAPTVPPPMTMVPDPNVTTTTLGAG